MRIRHRFYPIFVPRLQRAAPTLLRTHPQRQPGLGPGAWHRLANAGCQHDGRRAVGMANTPARRHGHPPPTPTAGHPQPRPPPRPPRQPMRGACANADGGAELEEDPVWHAASASRNRARNARRAAPRLLHCVAFHACGGTLKDPRSIPAARV